VRESSRETPRIDKPLPAGGGRGGSTKSLVLRNRAYFKVDRGKEKRGKEGKRLEVGEKSRLDSGKPL